jgi:excisionase family DNA binding protein
VSAHPYGSPASDARGIAGRRRWAGEPPAVVRLDSRLLTAVDVSELLCVPVSTVYELARTGRLPCLRIGRAVRFSRDDLEAHLSAWRGTG